MIFIKISASWSWVCIWWIIIVLFLMQSLIKWKSISMWKIRLLARAIANILSQYKGVIEEGSWNSWSSWCSQMRFVAFVAKTLYYASVENQETIFCFLTCIEVGVFPR